MEYIMTIRNTLLVTTFSAALLSAAPALAGNPGDGTPADMTAAQSKVTTATSTTMALPNVDAAANSTIEMDTPAAEAPLLEQKSADLLERADELDDAGMTDKAAAMERQSYETAIEAESTLIEAEMETGKELKFESVELSDEGETDDVIGEDATVLTQTDATTPVVVTQPLVIEAPVIDVPSVSATVEAEADAEYNMDIPKIKSPEIQDAPSAPDM